MSPWFYSQAVVGVKGGMSGLPADCMSQDAWLPGTLDVGHGIASLQWVPWDVERHSGILAAVGNNQPAISAPPARLEGQSFHSLGVWWACRMARDL